MNDSCINIDLCEYHFCNNKKKCIFDRKQSIENNFIPIRLKKNYSKRVAKLISIGHNPFCLCCDSIDNLTFDHIIPLSKGGENSLENGQILCEKCNKIKGNKLIDINELKNKIWKIID